MKLGHALFFMFVSFVLGASLVLLVAARQPARERVERVICESGAEVEPTETEQLEDPFLVWRSQCNVNDANGRVLDVRMID